MTFHSTLMFTPRRSQVRHSRAGAVAIVALLTTACSGTSIGGPTDAGVGTPAPCDGEIVDSADQCLMDDAYCEPLGDGRYCTGPAAPQCPVGSTEIDKDAICADNATCFDYSESLRCQRLMYTLQACEEAGGVAVSDPGDGSVVGVGCPDGGITLGNIDAGWDEGGLCCAPAED